MKVLMFGWEYPPHNSGGLGVACQGLSSALAHKNIDITFVLPSEVPLASPDVRVIFADSKNIVVKTLPAHLMPYVTVGEYQKLYRETGGLYGLTLFDEVMRYAESARALARREAFDIIHAHDWLSFPAGVAAKEATGKPLIVHVHATEFDRSGEQINEKVYVIEREGLECADRVITVSEYTRHLVNQKYGIPLTKIQAIHNGIDGHELPVSAKVVKGLKKLKKNGYKVVLFLGRITYQKGPDYFIQTAKRVLEYYPKVYFVVVGSGDMEGKMMEEAARLGISDKVLFVGFLRGTERSSAYQLADLFVMPSVSEPFGITPLESLMLGTPVLISKQSGVSEVLTHALKTDFWDIEEMTDKILSVLQYDSLKHTLGENGMKDAKSCSWAKAAEKCISVYNDLYRNT